MEIDKKDRTFYTELLESQMDRQNGYQGRNARNVYADMKRDIAETEIMLGSFDKEVYRGLAAIMAFLLIVVTLSNADGLPVILPLESFLPNTRRHEQLSLPMPP